VEAWAPPPVATPPDILGAVMAARVPGIASGPPPEDIDPIDAFVRTSADLATLLDSLDDHDWRRPTPAYGTVGGMVAHLVGIEHLTLGWFGQWPLPAGAEDHRRVARPVIDARRTAARQDVVDEWRALTSLVADAARRAPADLVVMAHDIPADRDVVMLLRTFEVWAHTDDIATALDRPLLEVDAGRLLTLSRALANGLPFTFALAGDEPPDADVRVVLTGRGGGTYDLTFGAGSGDGRAATIVVDANAACRLAQQRVRPDDLDVAVDGDRDLVALILDHVGTFARD